MEDPRVCVFQSQSLEQTGIREDVEIEVEKNRIIIRSVKNARKGWVHAFRVMAETADDLAVVDDDHSYSWDEAEWHWSTNALAQE